MQTLRPAHSQITQYVKAQSTLKHLNAFITHPPPSSLEHGSSSALPRNPLSSAFIAVKDNICTDDLPTTCASTGLRDYQSPFDATVIAWIRHAGAVIAGKTNLDEFGMGSHSVHSAFGAVQTPASHTAGGSSGGSAVAVATHQCDGALGTDTGGSVRLPAAYNGVFGFKPSYGLVSRWGVVAYANSLDTVGFLARDTRNLRALFEATNAHDPKDPTSLAPSTRKRLDRLQSQHHIRRDARNRLRVGVPTTYNTASLSTLVRTAWLRALSRLHEAGHTLHPIDLPTTQHALSAYYVLAPAEASSNLAKYDGVRYGSRATASAEADRGNNLFAAHRGSTLGAEVRRRILLGAYSLSAEALDNHFVAAQKVRRLAVDEFDGVFSLPNVLTTEPEMYSHDGSEAEAEGKGGEDGVDVIITPTAPTPPPPLQDVEKLAPVDAYTADVFTVPASLAGLPAVSVPVPADTPEAVRGANVGVQVIGQYGDDGLVLGVAEAMERRERGWGARRNETDR